MITRASFFVQRIEHFNVIALYRLNIIIIIMNHIPIQDCIPVVLPFSRSLRQQSRLLSQLGWNHPGKKTAKMLINFAGKDQRRFVHAVVLEETEM